MNTIKTKIGFETKPYTIPVLYFGELFNIPVKTYGTIFLVMATLLSGGSLAYVKQIGHQRISQLQSLQQETNLLEKQYSKLVEEYDKLSSTTHLKSKFSHEAMHQPTLQKSIYMPRNNQL